MGFLDRIDEMSERGFIQSFRQYLEYREKLQIDKWNDGRDEAYFAGRALEIEAMHDYLNERLRRLDEEYA